MFRRSGCWCGRVDDVVRDYEHSGNNWHHQQTITVRLEEAFDRKFQQSLKKYVLASAKGERDRRLNLAIHPPETLSMVREEGEIDLPVPADPTQAKKVLVELYQGGHDRAISQSFDKFHAVLGSSDDTFMLAYMAEINLGINGTKCDGTRIRHGIEALHNIIESGQGSPGSILYNIGNGWLALKEYRRARDTYNSALPLLDGSKDIAARCSKNLGTTLANLNQPEAARSLYERALELDPKLAEAHFALGLWHYRHKDADLDRALDHLDAIVWPKGSSGAVTTVQGWRAEILFRQQRTEEALREVRALLHAATTTVWVWPWCARLVAIFGRSSIEAAQFSVFFLERVFRGVHRQSSGKERNAPLCSLSSR